MHAHQQKQKDTITIFKPKYIHIMITSQNFVVAFLISACQHACCLFGYIHTVYVTSGGGLQSPENLAFLFVILTIHHYTLGSCRV